MDQVVIAGAGLAGLRSAEALRARGYQGNITMVGSEPHPPYDRPPLSKAVLLGTADGSSLEADFERLRVDLRLAEPAVRLSPGVLKTTRDEIGFDGLVIATGATPIRLPGEAEQHVLRTVDDALTLRSRFRPGVRVAVIGAGWIGAEVATAAAKAGADVTVIEAGEAPLAAVFDPAIGSLTSKWYAEAGVSLLLNARVADVADGRVDLADGREVAADLVVTGIGVRPAVDWLAGSPIEVDNGVLTSPSLQTSMPGVVAAGDCACWLSLRYGRRLRVEHWDTALSAPDVAAATLLGEEAVYDPVPYFWSEQFGRMVQFAGFHGAGTRLIWRGSPSDATWTVCWLTADDRLAAILTVGVPRDLVQARRLMAADAEVDPERLADPEVAVRRTAR